MKVNIQWSLHFKWRPELCKTIHSDFVFVIQSFRC